jgi:N-acyl homoserine lactone hydrolase
MASAGRPPNYHVLLEGFPGRSSRGFLGWSTIVLLDAANGPALFDTGATGDRPALMAALAARGLSPADIRTIVLSHLHFDHVGNVECFPSADVVIHQDELVYFYEQQGKDAALPVHQIEGMLARSKLQLINGELAVLPGFAMIRTPGHTAGHCSLVVEQAGETHVLAQDALKHRGEAETGEASGAFLPAAAAKSIARILALADIVVPGHDAPLRIANGRATPLHRPKGEISVSLDGRVYALEA